MRIPLHKEVRSQDITIAMENFLELQGAKSLRLQKKKTAYAAFCVPFLGFISMRQGRFRTAPHRKGTKHKNDIKIKFKNYS